MANSVKAREKVLSLGSRGTDTQPHSLHKVASRRSLSIRLDVIGRLRPSWRQRRALEHSDLAAGVLVMLATLARTPRSWPYPEQSQDVHVDNTAARLLLATREKDSLEYDSSYLL